MAIPPRWADALSTAAKRCDLRTVCHVVITGELATGVLERRLSVRQPGDLSTLSYSYQDRRWPYRRGETMLYPRQLMHWYACRLHNGPSPDTAESWHASHRIKDLT